MTSDSVRPWMQIAVRRGGPQSRQKLTVPQATDQRLLLLAAWRFRGRRSLAVLGLQLRDFRTSLF
jgi:hypothetical protein